ncbi:MAG: HlyD family efflux transporter periplasmic adaptor subunit [Candidatus Competibacteraceae bacterium]|nr:HlyD family efflux transporter periplasmic adaptor subunit [Candidatus Competibacteraceae bacterium]
MNGHFPANRTILCALAALLSTACGQDADNSLQGYVEGEYVYLAAPQSGYLKTLDAARGSRVTVGQPVFALAAEPDEQALAEAEARAESAKEKLLNLQGPRRPSEIAALEATLRAAEANLRFANSQLAQQDALQRKNFVSQSKVDEARSARDQASAQVEAAKQQITTYRTTLGRRAEVAGAEAEVKAATAQAAQKRWLVERKSVTAPAEGEVFETYYQPGEWVPAGSPVASLLPDARRRVRFFVPEPLIATLKSGASIEASCDGCPAPIRARVDFIAPKAEYTPPVIYSRGAREKLVFRVEAAPAPEDARRLHPGLPVDVRLLR